MLHDIVYCYYILKLPCKHIEQVHASMLTKIFKWKNILKSLFGYSANELDSIHCSLQLSLHCRSFLVVYDQTDPVNPLPIFPLLSGSNNNSFWVCNSKSSLSISPYWQHPHLSHQLSAHINLLCDLPVFLLPGTSISNNLCPIYPH